MTIKEMLDMVNAHNAIAFYTGTKMVKLVVTLDTEYGSPLWVNNVKGLTDYVDSNYVKAIADLINNCKDYELGVTKRFKAVDHHGWELEETVEFDVRFYN